MRPFGWVLLIVATGAVGRAADPDSAGVQRLICRLSSSDFHERETAGRELDRLGEASLGPLREAASTGDAETRRRAKALVEGIARRQAAERLLAPKLVSFNYQNTPLPAAVADLSRRTGGPINLHGDADLLKGRTVTLRAEKVTSWQAVRLLCNRANLREWDGLSPVTAGATISNSDSSQATEGVIVLGQMNARRGQICAVTAVSPASGIVLIDGPGPTLPTHHAGAIRVRAAPPGVSFPAAMGNDIVLALHVSAETRLHVDGATDLRIDRAVDERGQERIGRPVWPDPPEPVDDWGRGARVPPHLAERKHGPVAIRFPRDEAPPKRLRELSGIVTVQLFAAERVLEMAKPSKSVGRTVKGGSVSLSLLSLARPAGNELRVTAELQLPYGTRLENPVAGPIGVGGRGGGFGRNWVVSNSEYEPAAVTGTAYQGLSVEDAAGRPFSATSGGTEIVGLFPQHYTVQVRAVFHVPEGVEPARLAFAVHRPTTLEVPFSLKDVPLP